MKTHGNRKDRFEFFINSKSVSSILGELAVTELQKIQIREFLEFFNDGDRSGIWRKNIAIWITLQLDDWVERRKNLTRCTSNSTEWFRLMYGQKGDQKYKEFSNRIKSHLSSRIEYWLNKGFSEDEAKQLRSNSQKKRVNGKIFNRNMSVRCLEFWTEKGYSETVAKATIAALQKRDLDYFVSRYGEVEGRNRFNQSKTKRNLTWASKDKFEHAKKTQPTNFNENGQEMQAIRGFLAANNIPTGHCLYGKPNDQFWQQIPGIGYRRYDLAVFDNVDHNKLLYIVEYHGPGHINFSDYLPELENEYISIRGKTILHLGTYGKAYSNDLAKRNHIMSKYPDCQYITIWCDDLINRRFKIEELRRSK